MLRSIRWLRAQHFDLVIDLQCLLRSGAFAWLANGKFLVGLDEAREGARGFYDLAVRREIVSHARRGLVSRRAAARWACRFMTNFDWLPERPQLPPK